MSASDLFFKYSYNFPNFSLDTLIKYQKRVYIKTEQAPLFWLGEIAILSSLRHFHSVSKCFITR